MLEGSSSLKYSNFKTAVTREVGTSMYEQRQGNSVRSRG